MTVICVLCTLMCPFWFFISRTLNYLSKKKKQICIFSYADKTVGLELAIYVILSVNMKRDVMKFHFFFLDLKRRIT